MKRHRVITSNQLADASCFSESYRSSELIKFDINRSNVCGLALKTTP